jgi:hypothetical protein
MSVSTFASDFDSNKAEPIDQSKDSARSRGKTVGQNVGQMGGYGIGIAAEFVRQLPRISLIQYRIFLTKRYGPGGI